MKKYLKWEYKIIKYIKKLKNLCYGIIVVYRYTKKYKKYLNVVSYHQ